MDTPNSTPKKFTRDEFAALCISLTIDPAIALECEEVREALRNGGNVQQAIEENF